MADTRDADNETKSVGFDDLELDNLADHPRENVRIRERRPQRGWNIDKRPKHEVPPPGVSPQVEANLTAMAAMLKQMSEEIIQLRQEANIANAKAETAVRDATEAAQKTVVAQLRAINDSIDKAVQDRGEEIAKVLIDRIAGAQVQPAAQPGGVPVNGQAPTGAGDLFQAILAKAAMQEMGMGGSQNPFAQLTQAAQSMGSFYTALMEPLARMQQDVRRTTLQELIALDRTGGSLPWHETGTKPADDRPKVANFKQSADILAGKCRLR